MVFVQLLAGRQWSDQEPAQNVLQPGIGIQVYGWHDVVIVHLELSHRFANAGPMPVVVDHDIGVRLGLTAPDAPYVPYRGRGIAGPDKDLGRLARAKTDAGALTAAALWKSFTDPGHDLRARGADIAAPVLITWGAKDVTAPSRWGKAVQAAIPGSKFVAFPTGHVVFSSEPVAWLGAVLPFVDAAVSELHS